MATGAVLGTAELLANILHELDVKTLLLSRRVSRQWSIVIDSSPELQEKLYYRPGMREQTTRYLWTPKSYQLGHLEPLGDQDLPVNSKPDSPMCPRVISSMCMNLLLSADLPCLGVEKALGPADQGERIRRISINHFLKSPHGTWKSMFLCQPPATKIVARNLYRWPVDSVPADGDYLVIEDPTGVRMSQVVKEIVDSVKYFDENPRARVDDRLEDWRLVFPGRVDLARQAERMIMPPPPTPRPAQALSTRISATSQLARRPLLRTRTRT